MFFTLQLLWILFLENQVMEAIADLDSFDRLDLSENRLAFRLLKTLFLLKMLFLERENIEHINTSRLARLAPSLLAAALNKVSDRKTDKF